MKVGIAGAGAIAMGYAALLSKNGHAAAVWSPSGRRTEALSKGAPLKVAGAIDGEFFPAVCRSAEELAENEVIVLALPANGHRTVLDQLLPHLRASHCVVISGQLSFGALYLSKILAARGMEIPIAAWSTTALTSKAESPTEIRIGAIRASVDMAVVPARLAGRAQDVCSALFGNRFSIRDDVLTIALSNINPQTHLAIALCNLTRIERGEVWGQNSTMTPAAGRFLEALDRERQSVAKAVGKTVGSIFDFYRVSLGLEGGTVAEINRLRVAQGNDVQGPKDLNSRYVTEDVPFGLVPTLRLAEMAGVDAPLHRSGLAILSACYGRDFTQDNDLLHEIWPVDTRSLMKLSVAGYAKKDADIAVS